MKFSRIFLENFFSYGEEQSLDLSKPGLFLITGQNDEQTESQSNGAGKSTTLDGIVFALFGSVTKNVNLTQVVNEKIGQNCRVALDFYINNDYYRVERYAKHEKFHDKIMFYKNNELISKANKRDTQELIDSVIKINYKSFVNSILMSQENVGKFLEADSAKKKEIIENVLQLNVISQYHSMSQLKRKTSKKIFDRVQLEITNYENLISNTKDSATAYVNSCKTQKEAAEKKLKQLKDKLKELESTNVEEELKKITNAKELKAQVEVKRSEIKNKNDSLKSVKSQIETLESSKDEFESLISSNNNANKSIEKEIIKLQSNIDSLTKEIIHAREHPDSCPLCNNKINLDELEKWIGEKNETILTASSSIDSKKKTMEENREKNSGWNAKVDDLSQKIDELESQKKKIEKEIKDIQNDISEIDIPDTKDEEELNKLNAEIKNVKYQIENLDSTEYVDQDYLNGLINKAKELQNLLKTKKQESKKHEKEVLLYQWWENSLSSKKNSMKSWCVNNIIGYFNTRIKYYMDRFFDGDTDIQLDIELNESISRNGFERSFAMFSGGEKQRLNLAILFALNNLVKSSLSTKVNMMFLDEILSTSLDDRGISTVLELLEEMKEEQQTVFLIDHKDNFKDYPSFEQILVHKDKFGFSKIIETK